MTIPFAGRQNAFASSSAFQAKSKRKHGMEDTADEVDVKMRIRSPPLKRRNTNPPPELMTDHSNSASDEDQAMDMDDGEMHEVDSPMSHQPGFDWDDGQYGAGGSGGFGFGPGAEEDEMSNNVSHTHQGPSTCYPTLSLYPSLTPNPNAKNFTNLPPFSAPASFSHTSPMTFSGQPPRPSSPWSAQPFTTSLHAPTPIRGLLQPALTAPLPENASEIDKARAQHGAQCKSIPKLMMSQHPDAMTGELSMWSMCGDCGACEKAA